MRTTSTDRIERETVLRAPRARVWRALTDPVEFGTWFGVKLDGPFTVGETTRAQLTYPGYEHVTLELVTEKVEAQALLAFRWHPYAVQPDVDYSKEPMTLVELRLSDAEGGTLLRVTESGFDAIPASRRAEAFRMNDGGWEEQLENVRAHVEG
jgi:uncharacterized protein YndB with AHSA1/START domain